jgi:hypothetical protein
VPEPLAGAGTLALLEEALGFQSASQVLMEARAACWTAWIVGSATPEAVERSEQWKPSPTAMGCSGVL